MIKIGDRVRDKVSGFQGIATARHEYMNGCVRFTIDSEELKDGKPIDGHWFDEQQIEAIEDKALEVIPAQVGGPQKAPPSLKRPER
ncbi:MAG: hypothetical protein U9Q07_03800 [Planctomycetota bacterium]|nr:hypothetical protein [Planctomycetota bacterium]